METVLSVLSDRSQFVHVNDESCMPAKLSHGVPQGSSSIHFIYASSPEPARTISFISHQLVSVPSGDSEEETLRGSERHLEETPVRAHSELHHPTGKKTANQIARTSLSVTSCPPFYLSVNIQLTIPQCNMSHVIEETDVYSCQ